MPISGGTVVATSTIPASANAAETNVPAATTSTQLLAANAARKGFRIFNDSTSVVYISDGAAASATSYDFQIPPGQYYEASVDYTGPVFGLWVTANGNARVTELS